MRNKFYGEAAYTRNLLNGHGGIELQMTLPQLDIFLSALNGVFKEDDYIIGRDYGRAYGPWFFGYISSPRRQVIAYCKLLSY